MNSSVGARRATASRISFAAPHRAISGFMAARASSRSTWPLATGFRATGGCAGAGDSSLGFGPRFAGSAFAGAVACFFRYRLLMALKCWPPISMPNVYLIQGNAVAGLSDPASIAWRAAARSDSGRPSCVVNIPMGNHLALPDGDDGKPDGA
jgi:hypothetical protein